MDPQYTAEYEQNELHHWWYRARRLLIQRAIDRAVPEPAGKRWLDVGCGTGVLLDSYPRIADRMGLEMDAGSVERARSKGLDVRQVSPTWDFTAYGRFDLVTLCDVIEHVEHDGDAINAVRQVLHPGGVVLVTVPALKSLWSAHDVRNHHYRRYTRRSLLSVFDPRQWDVQRVTYFSSLLLPMVWTFRQIANWRYGLDPEKAPSDFKAGSSLSNALFYGVFRTEVAMLSAMNLPLGSSLLLVARNR